MELKRQLGVYTAVLVIVADMIGTGIFVTTGSVLGITGDAGVVLALWGIGGLIALTGSLCYAELASMWPQSGGEYVYLRKIFGPLPSFLSGWVSLVVGFTASVAVTALTLVWYLAEGVGGSFFTDPWNQKILAAGLIFIFGLIHVIGVRSGGFVQNVMTVVKIIIIISIIVGGACLADWNLTERLTASYREGGGLFTRQSGLALLIIMFAYSGWNGATYIAGEIKEPEKNLPKAMFWGVFTVTAIYLLLNVVFLISSPGEDIMGKDAVGAIAVSNLFGAKAGSFFSIAIVLVLLSAVSVQMMIGPRVYYAMAKDRAIFSSLTRVNKRFLTPDLAIWVQMFIAIVYIFIGKEHIIGMLQYMGFSLSIFPLITVIGLVYMRRKHPEIERPFKTPLYPLIPGIYILLTLVMVGAALSLWTVSSLFAIGMLAVGTGIFFIWRRFAGQ